MIVVVTLCAGCGREIEEAQAWIKEGIPYCCESCAEGFGHERCCGSDIEPEEPPTSDCLL